MSRESPLVIKFGGLALEREAEVDRYLASSSQRNPALVVVASAKGRTTDWLEQILRNPSDRRGHAVRLERIRHLHLDLPPAGRRHLATLRRLVDVLERAGGGDGATADRIRAMGERLSVHALAQHLNGEGLPAAPFEADRLGLRTDTRFGAATLRLEASAASVRSRLRHSLSEGRWPVVTGYFGRAPSGGPAVLGRGGSDYTASALGYLLGSRRVELVKPSGAIRSGDPRTVPATRTVPRLSYDEAEELAQFGAKVLHPLAVGPARRGGLELRVVGLHEPTGSTRIGPRSSPPGACVVTEMGPFRSIEVPVPGGRQRPGALAWISTRLAASGVPVVALFASAAKLTLLVPPASSASVLRDLRPTSGAGDLPRLESGSRALVSVVGSSMLSQLPKLPRTVIRRVRLLGATDCSLALVVDATNSRQLLRELHEALVVRRAPRGEPS